MKHPAIPYVLPFASFIAFLGLAKYTGADARWEYPLRVVAVTAVLIAFSRGALQWRPAKPLASVLLGILVFAIWVAPDVLWPNYRNHWLLSNAVFGFPRSSLQEGVRANCTFLLFRIVGTVIVVPIVEELFWRAWLLRYLISPDFLKVTLGTYAPLSFWLTALLFASEHGSYLDVGFVAGIAYNFWLCRTRTLADCILAHAVTNACLAAYVVLAHHWQYWL